MDDPHIWHVTEVHYAVESYFELPLMLAVIVCLGWVARRQREANLWFLVTGVVLLAARQGLRWLFTFDLFPVALAEQTFLIEAHLGTLGWLLIALYAAMAVLQSRRSSRQATKVTA
jgi:hypothetical protein